MELAKRGSLAEAILKSKKSTADIDYDNTAKQIILVGIARGMMYLYQHHIIHRDLKPDNILLDQYLHPLITDFGLSKIYDPGYSISQSQTCGTSIYMAPEIISGNRYSGKADVYSFGILMYEVITELVPYPLFQEKGKLTIYQFNEKVIKENYRPQFTFSIKPSLKNLVERCWSKDPNERPTFEEIFKKLKIQFMTFVRVMKMRTNFISMALILRNFMRILILSLRMTLPMIIIYRPMCLMT